MNQDERMSFEEVFKQNEKRIYFHMQRLGIYDTHREFYLEGLYAMWMAYKKYEPDKGPLSTFFNYNIRNQLIDKLRKKGRDQYKTEMFIHNEKLRLENGNRSGLKKMPVIDSSGIAVKDTKIWEEVKAALTENQWNWVYYYIIVGMPLKEIAALKGVSVDAVKSWGREARRKLRAEPTFSAVTQLLEL
ncbi:sigma-70 family RNA polymerase sigma factor [Virgibacillus oceani]